MLDGSGLCWSHKPETISRRRTWINKGKKYKKGHHNPWLGLGNFEEARGLLFYSLESDKPLLTLRALKKIISLRTLVLMGEEKGDRYSGISVEPPEQEEWKGYEIPRLRSE